MRWDKVETEWTKTVITKALVVFALNNGAVA